MECAPIKLDTPPYPSCLYGALNAIAVLTGALGDLENFEPTDHGSVNVCVEDNV
jgi:hypothetical protein